MVGVDEAGRGPLAGPLVAAAVILKPYAPVGLIRDSKRLSAAQREDVIAFIHEQALTWSVARLEPADIDRLNVLHATLHAMRLAVERLHTRVDYVLVDGTYCIPGAGPAQRSLVRGDQRSASVAAASIVAKVTRDRIMMDYHQQYPEYGFDEHKGYGTAAHLDALRVYGPCPIHRRSFAPVRELTEARLDLDA